MLKIITIFLSLILFFGMKTSSAQGIYRLIQENEFLKSELQLARSSQIYILFNLVQNKAQIKAKGVLLKELPIEKFTYWGARIQPKPITLKNKATILKPKRKKIKPKGNEEEDLDEIQSLGIDDMPVRYRLDFERGIHLYIRPKPPKGLSAFLTLFSYLKSYGWTRPIGILWNTLRNKPFTEIYIFLSPEDAKSLYWSMLEGTQCIILFTPISSPRTQGSLPYRPQGLPSELSIPPLLSLLQRDIDEGYRRFFGQSEN